MATAGSGFGYGGLFKCASPSGTGVRGYATAASGFGFGGDFQTDGPAGTAVRGIATSTSGSNYGVYAKTNSNNGRAIYGLVSSTSTGVSIAGDFENMAASGVGVHAIASSNVGTTVGGIFVASGTSGRGIVSEAYSATGSTFGGVFISNSKTGVGVYGTGAAGTDTTVGGYFTSDSEDGKGVRGVAQNSAGHSFGVYGSTFSPSNGYGVYSNGRSGASGTKSFRIDHPLDPEHKYLNHYCSEGPEPLNVYSGTATTDGQGYAWIQLPDYFDEINKDPRYQLTVISGGADFVQAMVSKKIEARRFQIRTSKPRTEVCWEVKGVRNDAFVRAYGAPVETLKPKNEIGRYQRPELYGKPQEMGIDAVAAQKPPEPPPIR